MSRTTPDPGAMRDLGQLITERKRALGYTFRKLAELSGDTISHARWQQLATGVRLVEFPEPATLLAIATAIDVDVTMVVVAAAKTIGLPVRNTTSSFATLLPSTVDDMDPEMRDALLRVIRLASRRTNASQEQGQKAGGTTEQPEAAIAAEKDRLTAEHVSKHLGVSLNPVPPSKRAVSESDDKNQGRKRGRRRGA